MKLSKKFGVVAVAVGLVVGLAPAAQAVDLTGTGASFPALLIEGCKAGFASNTAHSYVYASSSSGTGQANSDKSIGDFWMSDGAYTASTRRSSLIHVPLVAAPIAMMRILFGEIPSEKASSSLSNKPSSKRDMRMRMNSAKTM